MNDPTRRMRIGLGHDTHRLVEGGPLLIGGVEIPFHQQLDGHSDADVLLHAITDAILGAAALGDIGEWFPDHDPENANRDSAAMLTAVVRHVSRSHAINNIDCIVSAQQPKITPYKQAMRDRIASLLEIAADAVNIKAKTGEHVGPVGRGEAIVAQCIALLIANPD